MIAYETEGRVMSFERLREQELFRTFRRNGMKTPANLGVAFVRSTKPKANCRLKRTTYETIARLAPLFVRRLGFR